MQNSVTLLMTMLLDSTLMVTPAVGAPLSDETEAPGQPFEHPTGDAFYSKDTFVESGNIASYIFRNIRNEIIENSNRMVSELTEISKEAFACRTINDMFGLQNKIAQQISDNYFDMTSKLCGMLFDSCNETQELLKERTTAASEEISKALAA